MEVSVDTLSPHPVNAEIYTISDVEDLSESIDKVGLLEHLVVDQFNQVISGNRRLAAIQMLGWKQVQVKLVSVAPDDAAVLIVNHNKQRVKTNREILNEYRVLFTSYSKGQGSRSDLVDLDETSVRSNRGSARDKVEDG